MGNSESSSNENSELCFVCEEYFNNNQLYQCDCGSDCQFKNWLDQPRMCRFCKIHRRSTCKDYRIPVIPTEEHYTQLTPKTPPQGTEVNCQLTPAMTYEEETPIPWRGPSWSLGPGPSITFGTLNP